MEYETIKGYLLLNGFNCYESSMRYVLQNNYIVFVFDSITKNLFEVQYYYDEDVHIGECQNSLKSFFEIAYEMGPSYVITLKPLKNYSCYLNNKGVVLTNEKSTINLALDRDRFFGICEKYLIFFLHVNFLIFLS